ncbi:MAG: T9SS type A sorting domain-containing protein, partial [Bacteroidia bacterium]
QDESAALIAFLKTLSDTVFLNDPRWSDPFDPNANTDYIWDEGPFVFSWNIEDEFAKTLQVKAYPNPASHQITISYDNQQAEERKIVLSNLQGQNIWTERSRAETIKLQRQNWAAGVYMLEVFAANQRIGFTKIIFQ